MKAALDWARRCAPELTLAVLAGAVFLGCLGSVDLWGKREQRASAEAIDTIREGHWLVAQIQGRPRLEKPPLPRWTIALLMLATGRQEEWIVRLPSAASALGMVALVYALGRSMGGRSVGLAAGLALTSFGFFVSELRQAGNDGPLAFFTTLAIYAAWRRLEPDGRAGPQAEPAARPPTQGRSGWLLLMYAALGLGFLTKGPIILLLAAIAVLPYLACARRLRSGLGSLWSGWGLLLFLVLAGSWPIPVLLSDPKAADVWYLEMAQKAGSAGIEHHRVRAFLVLDWPWMTAPWLLIASAAILLPFLKRERSLRPGVWLPWWWAFGNLAMFCLWKVAKPNYFLPCLPGAALLSGIAWVRYCRLAHEPGGMGRRALRMLQLHWVLLFAAALVAPVVVAQKFPQYMAWTLLLSAVTASAVVLSIGTWRRGATAGALAPLVTVLVVGVLVGYGVLAPAQNAVHSHRALAATLDRLVPPQAHTIMFFHELDEGLWFYLRDRDLKPVPGSQPKYNDAIKLVDEFRSNQIEWDLRERQRKEKELLVHWMKQTQGATPYVLIRTKVYDLFSPDLLRLGTPIYREAGLKRNELVLFRVNPKTPLAAGAPGPASPRR